jgi:hypothetical protein
VVKGFSNLKLGTFLPLNECTPSNESCFYAGSLFTIT